MLIPFVLTIATYGQLDMSLIFIILVIALALSIIIVMEKNIYICFGSNSLVVKNLLLKTKKKIILSEIDKVVLTEKFNGFYDKSYFDVIKKNNDVVHLTMYPIKLCTRTVIEKLKKKGISTEVRD